MSHDPPQAQAAGAEVDVGRDNVCWWLVPGFNNFTQRVSPTSPPHRPREKEKMPWTPQEIEQLRELTKTLTVPGICTALAKNHHEVSYQIRKLGFKTKLPHERDMQLARRIFAYSTRNGISAAAKKYQITECTVDGIRKRVKKDNERRLESVTPERAASIRRMAMKYGFKRHMYAEYCEDFASHCVEMLLKYGGVTLDHAYAQFRADNEGDRNCEVGRAQRDAKHSPIVESAEEEYEGEGIQVGGEDLTRKKAAIIRMADELPLDTRQRAIFILLYHWALSQREVSVIFGIGESAMSHAVTSIQKIVLENKGEIHGKDTDYGAPGL